MVEIITGIVGWFSLHWADFIAIYLSLVGAASLIVKITPTLKDDDALKMIVKFMGKYVALNTNKGNTGPEDA